MLSRKLYLCLGILYGCTWRMAALRLIQLNEVTKRQRVRFLELRNRGWGRRAMPVLDAHSEHRPSADEIRGALGRMAASEAFRASPQLISFLRYVVEATLRGEQHRIKGYTIAIEALGRTADFDPQSDPIVRVEAIRLRRTLTRYYANGGKYDPVAIDLPTGSYVPLFRRAVASSPPSRCPSFFRARLDWRRLATGAALVLTGAAIYALLDFWFDFNTPNPLTAHAPATSPVCAQASSICTPANLQVGGL